MAAGTNGHHNERINSSSEKRFTGIGTEAHHLKENNMPHGDALKRFRTAGSISLSPELFEKLYLSSQNAVNGELRKTFGNPTPFLLDTGSYYFFSGLLMSLGGVLEFILGNTFPFVVFMAFGAFWLTLASTLQPPTWPTDSTHNGRLN
ncbi:hypothetical protein HYALB_00007662 [Hymenoscyphus albidus]|uniref:Uncharacterized protein n=1 Tax=Hymenoscyphus albidus TaxID=595503 RepID=A0A9N9Q0T9_9HELO|nr:hypothetical protein HYALB_00007662 [Hymenoscyphus albidus]